MMTETEKALLDELKRFLAERNKSMDMKDTEWLTNDIGDFGFDSVDKLDLVMAVEDRFNILFDANDVIKCSTLMEIAEFVDRLLVPT
jgi:acyl carrier protein